MKKKIWAVAVIVIILIILAIGGYVIFYSQKNKLQDEEINKVSEITIGKEAWIDSLTKINIKGTNDYFEITEKVKWEVPEYQEGVTISFSIAIPYTFVVDGVEYKGIYELNNSDYNKKDENLKYELIVVDLTKEGKIKVEVTKQE